jgi:DNA-binding transcriptional LysR family regulator
MRPTIDLERLRTFYTAAKSRKFNAAAEELGLDSSSVTRQIQGLERDLNCILFERGGFRGLQLTEKGRALQAIAHELLVTVAKIEPMFDDVDNKMEGHLKICVQGRYSAQFLSSCIHEFMEKYPLISLEIITPLTSIDVAMREADIVISPIVEEISGDFIKKELFTYNLKLYASKKYIERYGIPKDVADLENHRFVSASSPSVKFFSKINWYLNLLPGVVLEPYFISDSHKFVEDSIKKGIGIGSRSPQFSDENDPNLVQILPQISGPEVTTCMIYGEHFKNSKKVENLYSFLKEKISLFF